MYLRAVPFPAMDPRPDPTQAAQDLDELHAFFRHIQKKQNERWKEHADKLPHFRVWLSDHVHSVTQHLHNSLEILEAAREYGWPICAKTGISIGTQIRHMQHVYNEGRVPPECYYGLEMYEKRTRERARFFLGDRRSSMLLHHLAQRAPQKERDPLVDKIAFFHHCRQNDLPTIPILATFEDGARDEDYVGMGRELPPRDLFSKPVSAYLGNGARTWSHQNGNFKGQDGHLYDSSAVIDSLKQQSKNNALLLQPRAENHPRLRELTGGLGPSTLRIITIRLPESSPECFAAFLTTPTRAVPAPTFTHGTALASKVDLTSGRLAPPRSKKPEYLLGDRDEHPKSGESMTGFELPHWEDAKELALEAHAPLRHIVCVGWDLFLTPEGPRLLEGNNDCSATLTQITHQRLLGLTRFPKYFCQHLHRQEHVDSTLENRASSPSTKRAA